ncbi:MAG: Rnase Y domain-containing protein, partial [Pirellulaceae bacterium]
MVLATTPLFLATSAELGLVGLGGAIVGIICSLIVAQRLQKKRDNDTRQQAESQARQIVSEAKLAGKEAALQLRSEVEEELSSSRKELRNLDDDLQTREATLEQQHAALRKQEKMVQNNQQRLTDKLQTTEQRQKELNTLLDSQRQSLHELTGLNKEEATTRLLKLLESELEQEMGGIILRHEKTIAAACEEKSREILLMTMQRVAAVTTADSTTSTVDIPNDEMKGRIIGREGRNIRALEKATGVDVIIDDTPGVVIVSGFDPVRREVARQSLANLITDGRIH